MVVLTEIKKSEQSEFLGIAKKHFAELNPSFVPHSDWEATYFSGILANPRYFLRWIESDGRKAGFILYGIEDHRFLPRLTGMIYELYVAPDFRRRGLAKECALQALRELQKLAPSKIQLEVVEGNKAAAALWRSLGFEKVSERYVLVGTKP